MSDTVNTTVHTHILVDLDDLYVVCVKTETAEVDWVAVLDEVKNEESS